MKKALSIFIIVCIFSIVLISASLIVIEASTSNTANIKLIEGYINKRSSTNVVLSANTSTPQATTTEIIIPTPVIPVIIGLQRASLLRNVEVSCLYPIPKTLAGVPEQLSLATPATPVKTLKANKAIKTTQPQVSLQDQKLEQEVEVTEAQLIYAQMHKGVASAGDALASSP